MDGLTVNQAAQTTGWSARMLRYVDRAGLVIPTRSASGYRLYGPAELQRLRTLKELLQRYGDRVLSRHGTKLATMVRVTANQVLHEQAVTAAKALEVLEGARTVILEMK